MATLRIQDAFKVNQAPYFTEDTAYGERKVYAAEAYTESYMVRSDKTNQLCRYYVETEKGNVSAMSLFKIKPTADEQRNLSKMIYALEKLDKQSYRQFLYDCFSNELATKEDLSNFSKKYLLSTSKQFNVLAYTVANNNDFYNTLYCVILWPSDSGIATC